MTRILKLGLLATALSTGALHAQVFLADLQTDPSQTVRLYLDLAETTPAPVGTTLWLVADLSGNGVPTGQVTPDQIQNIINGAGDDRRFFSDTVPGAILGAQPGKYQRLNLSVPDSYAAARIGLILWSDASHDSTIGNAGDTFGYYDFGVVPPATVGNAEYFIQQNVHASDNLVTAVPEPAAAGAVAAALCLAASLLRRIAASAVRPTRAVSPR